MPPKPKASSNDRSILSEMLTRRFQQLEEENGGMEAFLRRTGFSRVTYYGVMNGTGNPTLKTVERLAQGLGMSVFELLGFDGDDARRAMRKSGIEPFDVKNGRVAKASAAAAKPRKPVTKKSPK